MRITFFFLLLSLPVFSQNPNVETSSPKPSQEIGLNLGQYFIGEYGINAFYKIRKKPLSPNKDGWERQMNYRFSGGFFYQSPDNKLNSDLFVAKQVYYKDSIYQQKSNTAYLMMGLEKLMKHNRHSYWFGFQAGPFYSKFNRERLYQRFDGKEVLIKVQGIDNGQDFGWLIDLNTGYKFALTKNLAIGAEVNFWWKSLYTLGNSFTNIGTKYEVKSYNFNGDFHFLPSTLFMAYNF
jgi:hypothetical protein